MKFPFKPRAAAASIAETAAEPIASAAPQQAAPPGSGKYTGLLTLLVKECVAMIEMTGASEEFELAQALAVGRGITVDAALRARLDDLRGQRESIWSAQRVLRAKRLDHMQQAGPLVSAAIDERAYLANVIRSLQSDIAGFDGARATFSKRLVDTGLTVEEIADIEPKPTHADLAGWRDQLAEAQQRDDERAVMLRAGASAFLPQNASETA